MSTEHSPAATAAHTSAPANTPTGQTAHTAASAATPADIPAGAIVTVTPNPAMDRTAHLTTTLVRGDVHRLTDITNVAAGKGINVALATLRGGQPTVAIAPASADAHFTGLVADSGLTFIPTPSTGAVRVNLTVLENDGTTTKLNEPGSALGPAEIAALDAAIDDAATHASWIVLAGSLPPGLPADWFATTVQRLRAHGATARIAVDTSDAPLQTLGAALMADPTCAPDVLKPNGLEIGQMLGIDGQAIEDAADAGDFGPAAQAARSLVAHGVAHVLLTLGGAGAVLATAQSAWAATPPPITPVSTVGAGDSSLAGFLLASTEGHDGAAALCRAVAYGTAATSLPGTTLPYPEQTYPELVKVTELG